VHVHVRVRVCFELLCVVPLFACSDRCSGICRDAAD